MRMKLGQTYRQAGAESRSLLVPLGLVLMLCLSFLLLPAAFASSFMPVVAKKSSDASCFRENLVLPTRVSASMIHAGVKADISNPDQPEGSWQSAVLSVHYPAISAPCVEAGYRRIGRAWMEITYKDHWRSYDKGWRHPIYSRITEGEGGTTWSPSGHEEDWYYWDPGDRVRAKVDTVVKSPTGRMKVSRPRVVRVKVSR